MGVLGFALKTGVAGGCVYYTVKEGLWSTPEDSVKLYGKIYNKVAPYVKENIPKEVVAEIPNVPSLSCVSSFVKSSWNKGVVTTFQFVSELPEHTSRGIEATGIKEAILGAIDSVNAPEKPNES